MREREHIVATAGYWFRGSREHQRHGRSAEAIMCMENAYNHVENALAAAQEQLAQSAPQTSTGATPIASSVSRKKDSANAGSSDHVHSKPNEETGDGCACVVKPGRWVVNPRCQIHKSVDIVALARSVRGRDRYRCLACGTPYSARPCPECFPQLARSVPQTPDANHNAVGSSVSRKEGDAVCTTPSSISSGAPESSTPPVAPLADSGSGVADRWKSIAYWPKGTMGGAEMSVDYHDTEDAAVHVCRLLASQGFGGDGKVFPLAIKVERATPVLSAPTDEEVKECRTCAFYERMGIKTLDAKWLDPECWDGCQSLVLKHRADRYEKLLRRVLEWCGQDSPNFEIDVEAIHSALSSPSPSPQQQKEESPNGGSTASTDAATSGDERQPEVRELKS